MAFKTIEAHQLAKDTTAALFAHFEGSPTKIGRTFKKGPSEVISWRKRGYISKPAAAMCDELVASGKLPNQFSKESLRPDVKW